MKKLTFLLIIGLLVSLSIRSQNIIDDNTALIDSYFKQHKEIETSAVKEKQTRYNNDVIVIQQGDNNHSFISILKENKQQVVQKGNDNNYEYYAYFGSVKSNIDTKQYGNNNSIQIYGQNNISKDLKINQNANNQTIIITNY